MSNQYLSLNSMKNVCKLFSLVVIFTTCFAVSHSLAAIEDDIETIFQNASPQAKRIFSDGHPIHSWRDVWFLKTFGRLETIPEERAWEPKRKKSKKKPTRPHN